ncbi:MAG TPA: UvrD-helicase domain-containing protein [Fibrobacteraceae bacterium]|jgi:DNA helicase-2/ATP-dependent DNA helicase PcrA|nr:UvrD-helicase domain-containing protein [Fibrobacteraceae bacterium]
MDIGEILKGLNSDQRKAVLHDHEKDAQLLILAGAGSGKTSVLTKRIQYRIASGVCPDSILSLTFTAKAALEMKERVCQIFPEAGVRLCTFHSLALFLLREKVGDSFGYERLGFQKPPIPVESDVGDFACDLVRFGLGAKSVSREELFSLDLSSRLERELIPVRKSILLSGHVIFDDLIYLAIRLLENDPEFRAEFRGRWTEFLVDEYQDINPAQYRLVIALLGDRKSLFVVGDDDQAIYGFRGADIGNIIRFQKDFKESTLIRLEWNYRSTPSILHLANRIFTDKPVTLRKVLRAGNCRQDALFKENRKPEFWESENPVLEMSRIVQRIKEMRLDYDLDYEAFAILVRYNHQRIYYEEALKDYGLPIFQVEEEGDVKGVHVETVHSSKGLQYPVVFYAGLAEKLTPGSCRGSKKEQKKQIKEERRLFYVGVTRAEALLVLLYCSKRHWKGRLETFRKSRFLKCLEKPLPESIMPLFLFRIFVLTKILCYMGIGILRLSVLRLVQPGKIKQWVDLQIQAFGAYCIRSLRVDLTIEDQALLGKVDWSRPVVVIGNHQSYADIPVVFLALSRTVGFLAKRELKLIPFLGFWMKKIGCIFIDRNKKGAGLEVKKEILESKEIPCVFIFPEGTRSKNGSMLPFKSGGFRMAVELEATLLPVVLHGTRAVWESRRDSKICKVSARILEPLDTLALKKEGGEIKIREYLMPKIRKQMEDAL